MINKSILKLKNENSIVSYMQILQNNILRMSNHSINIKSSICLIYTIIIMILIALEKMSNYWWVTIAITLVGAIIDACYLGIEKIYIDKYNIFLEKLNKGIVDEIEIYDMNPRNTKLRFEMLAMILSSFLSFSIYAYYSLLILISIFVRFV